jgi:hypothetical protein
MRPAPDVCEWVERASLLKQSHKGIIIKAKRIAGLTLLLLILLRLFVLLLVFHSAFPFPESHWIAVPVEGVAVADD